MILLIVISALLALILWILLAPVIIRTDTQKGLYRIMLPGIVAARALPFEGLFKIRIMIFFIPFHLYPHKLLEQGDRDRRSIRSFVAKRFQGRPKRKKRRLNKPFALLKGFRIRHLDMNIDTGDFSLNAWLIPVLSTVNGGNVLAQVNFTGDFHLNADVRFRLGQLLRLYLQHSNQTST